MKEIILKNRKFIDGQKNKSFLNSIGRKGKMIIALSVLSFIGANQTLEYSIENTHNKFIKNNFGYEINYNHSDNNHIKESQLKKDLKQIIDKKKDRITNPLNNKDVELTFEDNIGSYAKSTIFFKNDRLNYRINQNINYDEIEHNEMKKYFDIYNSEDLTFEYIIFHEFMHLTDWNEQNIQKLTKEQQENRQEIAADVASVMYVSKINKLNREETNNFINSIIAIRSFNLKHPDNLYHFTNMGLLLLKKSINNEENFLEKINYQDIEVYSTITSDFIFDKNFKIYLNGEKFGYNNIIEKLKKTEEKEELAFFISHSNSISDLTFENYENKIDIINKIGEQIERRSIKNKPTNRNHIKNH